MKNYTIIMFIMFALALIAPLRAAWATCDVSGDVTAAYSGDTCTGAGYSVDYLHDTDPSTYWGSCYPSSANLWWEGAFSGTESIYEVSFVAEVQGASSDTWTVELGATTGSIGDYVAECSWSGLVMDGDMVTITCSSSFDTVYPVLFWTSSAYPVAATDLVIGGSDCDGDGEDSLAAGGTDCDDDEPLTYSGAADTWYDGIDSDCDGASDYDADADGYDSDLYSGTDCDDTDSTSFPGGIEVADGADNDCDGEIDEGTSAFDDDGDGYSEADGDCDDSDAAVSPGATEVIYDGVDNDCDASTPDDDLDGDGYGVEDDCDDADADVNPDATELCNGYDDNCDGEIDEGYPDTNGNGILDCQETDDDGDGYAEFEGDCNDDDPVINPGAEEVCDFADNNCNGEIDEGLDSDGDGYTDCAGDCAEGDATVYPGADEVCDEQDNNCNGQADEGFDADADGFTTCGNDCNDADDSVHPEAYEVCGDDVDQDCDGTDLVCEGEEDTGEAYLKGVYVGGGGCRCSSEGSSAARFGWFGLVVVFLIAARLLRIRR